MAILHVFEAQTTVWQKLREHIELQIHNLRMRNDGDLDINETNRVRGQIRALKNLLLQADAGPGTMTLEPDD